MYMCLWIYTFIENIREYSFIHIKIKNNEKLNFKINKIWKSNQEDIYIVTSTCLNCQQKIKWRGEWKVNLSVVPILFNVEL